MMRKELTLLLSLAVGARGARVSRGKAKEVDTIDGVPVLSSNADLDDFVVQFAEGTTEEAIENFCKGECGAYGHPEHGGVAWASVHGREHLELLMQRRSGANVESIEGDEPVFKFTGEDESGVQSTPWGIHAVGADNANGDGRGTHIYVQDTGIRVTHRDFGGRATTSIDMTNGGSLTVCGGNQNCAGDTDGHGTHCAGIAGGTVYGVAKRALVYSVKSLTDSPQGAPASWQFSAAEWVTQNARMPAVLSLSFGSRSVSQTWDRVVRVAVESGIVVVAAAGNDRIDACRVSPAFSSHAVTVGAVDSVSRRRVKPAQRGRPGPEASTRRSSFSNWGNCVDIMAPGKDITSAWIGSDTDSVSIWGTSMACPHVSGGAALILGRSPGSSVSAVRDGLHGSSNAITGAIGNLQGSPDRFLWVGRGSAPSWIPGSR